MKKKLAAGLLLLALFGLWTMLVRTVDLQIIGPQNTAVGLAGVNRWFHGLTGVNWGLYHLTDWLGLVPVGICACFGLMGLLQWIRRGSIARVDRSILALGGFYLSVMGAFLLFELVPINYRPVLVDGALEASYPSSTTLLTMCVLPAAALQLRARYKNGIGTTIVMGLIAAFTAFMVVSRMISGVHWLTDIVGGLLLSGGLLFLYWAASGIE